MDFEALKVTKALFPAIWTQLVSTFGVPSDLPEMDAESGYELLLELYDKYEESILKAQINIRDKWYSVEQQLVCKLCRIFDCREKAVTHLKAYLSVSSTSITSPDYRQFLVPFYLSVEVAVRVCAHEMLHFLFYQQLRRSRTARVADPVLESQLWVIGEAIVPLVLCHPEMRELIGEYPLCSYACDAQLIWSAEPFVSKYVLQMCTFDELIDAMLSLEPLKYQANAVRQFTAGGLRAMPFSQ